LVIVDTHAHVIVPEITRQRAPGEDWRPHIYRQNGQQIIEYGGKQIKSAIHEFVDIEKILHEQAVHGVNQVLLCPWVSLLRYEENPEMGLRISQIQNEGLVKMARAYPQQVNVLGTVPLQAPDLAANELLEWMKEPGFCGVEVAASVNGVYLGDECLEPFWAAAEQSGAIVFIHPTTRGFSAPVFQQYYLWNTVGNPLETTVTAAHMIMAGVMQAHPRLKVILAHGGGSILALRGRLRHAHSFQPQARAKLAESPEDSLKRFYFDALTHDLDLLRALVAFAGADHVLLGSDYPFDMGDDQPAANIQALELPDTGEGQILSGNALRLMRKEV
jgi:aminocarboxymuconate-semialdehyde decarboxylase